MDPNASRASRAAKRIALNRLVVARRRGLIDRREYRLRRQLARRAETMEELWFLLEDLNGVGGGRDHWRYGRWLGPVRDGHELEIQRFVGAVFLVGFLVVVAAVVYAAIVTVDAFR
ncbi:hypothetical protein [Glycomyces salinus]|uniref:hypothetical protein n=1 Tax=Glycomyces salinus TaxID=980294 RepID=UPI0018EBA271|nr:hypothetical protein [Glycomyces salinus]